jgi:hypothetical protein
LSSDLNARSARAALSGFVQLNQISLQDLDALHILRCLGNRPNLALPSGFLLPNVQDQRSLIFNIRQKCPCFLTSFPATRHQEFGGADRDRTGDPLLAKQVLSQLSYSPLKVVGLDRLELSTSPLSGVRSSHLSYRPKWFGPHAVPKGSFSRTG